MKLVIAIPALNEESVIAKTIQAALDAVPEIVDGSPVTEVTVTVVSDGSSDRTVEIAQGFRDRVTVLVFPQNRGYGAAIKEAWERSDAELLGMMDGDGTCAPLFFGELCRRLEETGADIAIGGRLHPGTRMPAVRRFGNRLFALMLTVFSARRIRDAASGMRVVRRAALAGLMPLPDGLHFTPAMSARAILGREINIVELDMPYRERVGQSKLRVFADGMRFLRVILQSAFLYRPAGPLVLLGAACMAVAVGLMLMPALYYLQHRKVLEWMIYRFVVGSLLGSTTLLLWGAAYLGSCIVHLTVASAAPPSRTVQRVRRFLCGPLFWVSMGGLAAAGGMLVVPSFVELVTTGATYEHWSRFIVMSFLLQCAVILGAVRMVDYTLGLIAEQAGYFAAQGTPRHGSPGHAAGESA